MIFFLFFVNYIVDQKSSSWNTDLKACSVTPHFEKITHFEFFFFQSALNFEQPQRTLIFFFQIALNLGLDQAV
jgi:hypothetical protein